MGKEWFILYLQGENIYGYKMWKGYESIFISAPTGTGKTTFVLQTLLPEAKKEGKEVLFLSNRFLLKEQIKKKVVKLQKLEGQNEKWFEQVEEFDGITVMTYQKLQLLWKGGYIGVPDVQRRYKYVIYDEAHYLLTDSSFNPEILYLLEFLRAYKGISVFMSATMQGIPEFIKALKYPEKMVPRSLQRITDNLSIEEFSLWTTYTNGVKFRIWEYTFQQRQSGYQFFYYCDLEEILPIINQDDQEKWLIFLGNKTEIGSFSKKIIRSTEFITTESKLDLKKSQLIDSIRDKEKFDCQVLLSTSVLDNGVNIRDRKLKNLDIETNSETEFLQMLGRKRKEKDESVNVYIPCKGKKYFSALLKLNLNPAFELLQLSQADLMEKMLKEEATYRNVRRFFTSRDGELCKNPLAEQQLKGQIAFCERMIDGLNTDPWFYVKEQLSWVGLENTFALENSLSERKKGNGLEQAKKFFTENVDQDMNKAQQKVFCEKLTQILSEAGIQISKKGRLPGLNLIKKFMETYDFPYEITAKGGKKKGEETIWRIRRKTDGIYCHNKI